MNQVTDSATWLRTFLASAPAGASLVNDSKTPSGRAHVGALRGVLIHDEVRQGLSRLGRDARFTYGVDDMDPLDELPASEARLFEGCLGRPLCQTPPPQGSTHASYSEHYFHDFHSTFEQLGVEADVYRMSTIYRSGSFNDAIHAILLAAPEVRRIYARVSGADRPDDWLPFQPICERCGRVGTTRASDYRDGTVAYACVPDLVTWARGCGHTGRVSPFDGRGKLPWKLEWTAKWATFGVTIEGAGEDHCTKGGSREVAAACLAAIFGKSAPINIPYGFVLISGAKMSSSRGLGVSAREAVDLLPPDVLRFLMLRPKPLRQVDFAITQDHLVKLFAEFDREGGLASLGATDLPDENGELERWKAVDFGLVMSLAQLRHLDPVREIERLRGRPLSDPERDLVGQRLSTATLYLERYAAPEDVLKLQPSLPASAVELDPVQLGFLATLADLLDGMPEVLDPDRMQATVFNAARLAPIAQKDAFHALYRVFFDRPAGPKAGNFLAALDRSFVVARLRAARLDLAAFLTAASLAPEDFLMWLESAPAGWAHEATQPRFQCEESLDAATGRPDALIAVGAAEVFLHDPSGRRHLRRVLLQRSEGCTNAERELAYFRQRYEEFVRALQQVVARRRA